MKARATFEIYAALGFVMFQNPIEPWKSPNYCIQYDIDASLSESLEESESFKDAALAFGMQMRDWSDRIPHDTKVELNRLFGERHRAECKKNSLSEK